MMDINDILDWATVLLMAGVFGPMLWRKIQKWANKSWGE
jgi:hypothetical protein